MKQQDLNANLMSGKIMCVGTYHNGRLETIQIRDKQAGGGARRPAYVSRETILTDTDPIVISRWLKDGEDFAAWKQSAKKNDKVVVTITGMQAQNGITILNGVVEPLVG